MKKKLLLPLILSLLLLLAGCSKTKLEPGQSLTAFKKGSVTVSSMISDKDAKSYFGIRFKDSKKEIKEDIVDYFSDIYDDDIKITKFKKGKDYISFTYTLEDAEDLGFYDELSLEDYADKNRFDDVEELADTLDFITYGKEKSVDSDDIDKYEDDFVQRVQGGSKGAYYKMPKKILLVTDDLKYEKVSNDTIFVKRNSTGIIVFKK